MSKTYSQLTTITVGKSVIHLEDLEDLSNEDKLVIGDTMFAARETDGSELNQYVFYTGIFEK